MGDLAYLEDFRSAGWVVAKEACRHCGPSNAVFVLPIEADFDRLECERCGERTAAVTHTLGEHEVWTPRMGLVRQSDAR